MAKTEPELRLPLLDPSPIAEYRGPFAEEQATRLLWRAGFGPCSSCGAAPISRAAARGRVSDATAPSSPSRASCSASPVGPVLAGVRITLSGQVSQTTWHLKAGRYELYCSMPGHLKMGMHARLTVTRT